ncbi:MAG TPA: AarF/ABC1/UbiB kinase family protein [Longimicrobiales bacterium]|nr:AarF/ABC1/UbiB kinase family protein [Longimicrobiales bacterium]
MGLSMDPKHLKRYARIARLLVRHGRGDIVRRAGLEDVLDDDGLDGPEAVSAGGDAEVRSRAESLAAELEAMGPTFIKLGQLLSTRVDLLPPEYLQALARLQDRVDPFPFEEVERIVSDELGVRLSKAFASFDREALAAASLAQVHRAVLRDGRAVAVKVQRPGIRRQVREDLEALGELATFLDDHSDTAHRYRLAEALEQFRRSLLRELDYRNEARNLEILARNLADVDSVWVPEPVQSYSTGRVLTMELVHGRKVTALSPLALMELDRARLADDLFRAYLKQILVDGFFHADPHPGNVFITDEGQISLLDVGMTATVSPELREQLLKLLLAVADGQPDDASEILIELSEPEEGADLDGFRRAVGDLVLRAEGRTAADLALGVVVLRLVRLAGEHHISPPSELTMIGKTLFNLDEVGRTLDPDLEPNAAIRRHAGELMERRMMSSMSPASLLKAALETNELVQRMPRRLNQIMELLAENRMTLHVKAIDEIRLISGLEKIANRITLGLVIAALILGAATLVRVDAGPEILGYPALSLIFFVAAAVAGIALALRIVMKDGTR